MDNLYDKWYDEFKSSAELFEDDELFGSLESLIHSSKNTFAFNRKLMAKAIDVTWVEAIENGLVHLDNVLRTPRRTIEDVEEIVPIALSRKITVESVKHLAQHTDLIQSIDKKTGKITPSKILNIHKEESFLTYENKFVNTLVDRLYIFITTRYEKLAQVARDEEVFSLGYDTFIDNGAGGKMKVEVKIETTDSLDTYNESGLTVWQRVEKLKKAIEGYKGSELCQALGNTFIRPPVMRTNAIMKNVDLKACLALWQYIEGYDKVGYEINVENTAVKPEDRYVEDFYKLVIMNLLLFRSYTDLGRDTMTDLKTQKQKSVTPKFVKDFSNQISGDLSMHADGVAGYIAADGQLKLKKNLPADVSKVFSQVNEVIEIEKAYLEKREIARIEKLKAEEEAERRRKEEEERLEEQKRIEEARQAELERIRLQKEAEEREKQEMLEQKRREQEEEERERQRLEKERAEKLEALRIKREEEAKIAAERERIKDNKTNVLTELGEAEGIDKEEIISKAQSEEEELRKQAHIAVTSEDIEEAKAAIEEIAELEQTEQMEDPRAVAERNKMEQQRKEKERREAERAQRLKAERTYFENKPFREIYKEYSKNPIYVIARAIRYVLAMVFGIIPENTDDPRFKKKRAEIEAKKRRKKEEKEKRNAMEVYYKKYAQTFKYRVMRAIGDYKFKKKKRQQMKNKPKPVYNPPKRTPEEQKAIDEQMKKLYKEYHVTKAEKFRRFIKKIKRDRAEDRRLKEMEHIKKVLNEDDIVDVRSSRGLGIISWILSMIAAAALAFVIYVLVCAARGKAVNVFGKSVLTVVTGSMEPSIHTGEHIVVEKTDTAELKEGDIITFYSEQSDIYGMLVTHRITAVNEDGTFTTKGDANPIEDSVTVKPDKVLGKYVRKARFLIWVNSFTDPKKLMLMLVVIPIAVVFILEIKSLAKLSMQVEKETREQRRERLIREGIEKEKKRLAEEDAKNGKGDTSPPVGEEKSEPSEEEKSEPSEEEKSEPSEEEKSEPSEEEKSEPSEEEKSEPSEEEKSEPSEEEKSEPSEEEKSEPSGEEKSEPSEEEKSEPSEEEKSEPSEEVKSEPSVEEKSEPSGEVKSEPSEEEKSEPSEEEKSEPSEEEKSEPSGEEKSEPSEEEKSEPSGEVKPQTAQKPKPQPKKGGNNQQRRGKRSRGKRGKK